MAKCKHCGEDHTRELDARIKEVNDTAKRITLDLVNAYEPADALLIIATAAAALTVNAEPRHNVGERTKAFIEAYLDLIISNPRP